MEELEELLKKPETFKEKIKDFWFTISYCYPRDIRDFWWGLKRFFRNLKRYRNILWNDNDFDYGYLDEMILTKLEFMARYFRTARIAEGTEKVYEEICWAIRLGRIFMEKENFGDESKGEYIFEFPGYVNIKNIKRFYPRFKDYDRLEKDKNFRKMILTELRKQKAKNCFHKLLRDKEQTWWD